MSRTLAFILFFSVFFSIYFGMHLYVFLRLSTLLSIRRNLGFYLVVLALALSFPLMSVLERFYTSQLCRVLYAAAATWLGALFLLFSALLVYEVLRLLIQVDKATAGIVILAVVTGLLVFGILNALVVRVHPVEIQVPGLQKGLRLVQLSDIHVGTIHNSGYLRRLVERTNSLNPDMVLITGDLVDSAGPMVNDTILVLNQLQAKTFFTTGNHETYTGIPEVTRLLAKTKVVFLRNEVVDYQGIQIVGIDNPDEQFSKKNHILSTLPLDRTKPAVLMFHPPTGLEESNEAGITLQLSGHTHDGQVMPFNLVVRMFFPRISGLYNYKGTFLYVSPGSGTWGPPLRIGSRNEITLLHLIPQAKPSTA